MSLQGNADNFRKVFSQADAIDLQAGQDAFPCYHRMMQELSSVFGYSLEICAAVFASLSPNNDYLKTLRSTVTLLDGYKRDIDIDRLTVSTYNACKMRAWSFINGVDFLATTKGPKIRAFYTSIVNPLDSEAVVIDGHMVSAWVYKRKTMLDVAWQRFSYKLASDDLKTVAREVGMLPSSMQSTIWFVWKRINRVLYRPTLDLFGDHWQLRRSVADIKPYPIKEGIFSKEVNPA